MGVIELITKYFGTPTSDKDYRGYKIHRYATDNVEVNAWENRKGNTTISVAMRGKVLKKWWLVEPGKFEETLKECIRIVATEAADILNEVRKLGQHD